MREVIDFNKNFLTGEVTEVKKYKEDTMYKGTATVQIFDEKGEVIQEAKSTNCISKAYLSMLYVNYFKDALIHQNSNLAVPYPAQKILLTDSPVPEDPEDLLLRGNLIGWADGLSTYSGSDSFLGTLNTAESSKGNWNRHIVIDFPTHACNGTFQSIYWTNGDNGQYATAYTLGCTCEKRIITAPNSSCMAWSVGVINDFVYTLKNTNTNKIEKHDINGEVVNTVTLPENCIAMATSDFNLYAISTSKIYKLGPELNLISTISHAIPNNNNGNCNAVYTSEGIVFQRSNHPIHEFYVVDYNNGSIKRKREERLESSIMSGYYMDGLSIYENVVTYILAGRWVVIYNSLNNTIEKIMLSTTFKTFGGYGEQISNIHFKFYDKKTKIAYVAGYQYNAAKPGIYSGSLMPYFAHTTLPAPVTKTSANTMKIQYDFVVEPRGYFQI